MAPNISKKQFRENLKLDKLASNIKRKRPRPFTDFEWRLLILLKKAEYYNQFKLSPLRYYYLIKYRRRELKYMTFIPLYTCAGGLSIAHIGGIRINSNARLGKFCRIQEGVTIGATNHSLKAPQIGDFVYIGSGAKIIGDIFITSYAQVPAGAVVVKSIEAKEVGTWGGVPARKISSSLSSNNLMYFEDK